MDTYPLISHEEMHTIQLPSTFVKTIENDSHHVSLSFTSSISSALDIDKNNCSNKSNYELNSTVNTVQTDNITIESEDDLYSDIVHTNNSDSDIDSESNNLNNTCHNNNNTDINMDSDSDMQGQTTNYNKITKRKGHKQINQHVRTRLNKNKYKHS